MSDAPRVALFADTFYEINGAALTCRQLDAYARRSGLPFLCVRCGPEERNFHGDRYWLRQLRRGALAVSIDRDLAFDPLLITRRNEIEAVVRSFRPEIIHVTSPGDLGILGLWIAHRLRIPLIAAWHTNLHQFAARRLDRLLRWLPDAWRTRAVSAAERWILRRVLWFYGRAGVALAPNHELSRLIGVTSGKPVFLMNRGIDTAAFSPQHRSRAAGPVTIGFTGRLMPEKNVRFLARVQHDLDAAGFTNVRFLVVGDGNERAWLRQHLRNAELPGVLTGAPLAEAYANMDIFAFPSRTDTYGNVVLEAMASGVPAVVTNQGGPKYLVRSGVTGYVAGSDVSFLDSVRALVEDASLRTHMGDAAREHVRQFSWDHVFESEVYAAYRLCLSLSNTAKTHALAGLGNETFTAQSQNRSH